MPWTAGVQPVANEVQATGVTMGSDERSTPDAERRQRAARLGRSPRSNQGPNTAMVPPSRPRNRTRDTEAGMSDGLEVRRSDRSRSPATAPSTPSVGTPGTIVVEAIRFDASPRGAREGPLRV